EDGAVGKLPSGRSAGRGLRVGDFVEADLAVAGNGEEAFLDGVIAPELGVDGIGDEAGRDLVVLGGGEDAGLAELTRELGALVFLVVLDELMNAAAGEIEEVDFAVRVLAPGDDAICSAGELTMLSWVDTLVHRELTLRVLGHSV